MGTPRQGGTPSHPHRCSQPFHQTQGLQVSQSQIITTKFGLYPQNSSALTSAANSFQSIFTRLSRLGDRLYLNRKDEYLWGIVSNGLKLRLLRDNRTLTRQAYIEFNLESIFSAEGQAGYADFFLLWLICHRTRFDAPGGGDKDATAPRPNSSWIIEVWTKTAELNGVRAQQGLRQNAVRALNHLGSGFLSHRANDALRQRLQQPGGLGRDDFKRQLLRTLYRLLFLFVAEDRGLLLDPKASPTSVERFATYYSTIRLRRLARRYCGTAHGDGWVQLKTVFRLLRVDSGCPELGLPPLGGFLFSDVSCPDLDAASLANESLYAALRSLCVVQDKEERITRVTDFEHLGAEELGGIYESLLELDFKEWSVPAGLCELADATGNERKLTGSYYTPTSLITSLLDTALDPIIERALGDPNPEDALLALKLCDPACGSGHFLVAAGHRLARRIAALRTGEREPPVEAVRHALREVAARCLYGVDLNPLSVELCKVSIWLEALEPGRPLAFLESHIQCGNSLLGCTPALLKEGLPDEAFKPISGDDPAAIRSLIKDNRDARDAKQDLFDLASRPALAGLARLPDAFAQVEALPDDSPDALRQKENRWTSAVNSADYVHEMLVHDAWCAAFVLPRRLNDFTYHFHTGNLRKLERSPEALSPALRDAIERLAGNAPHLSEEMRGRSYRFFHWHLRFPGVFRVAINGTSSESPSCGWSGGFDVVLGNPPWEHTELKEKEFFANHPRILNAQTGAERKRLIENLSSEDPELYSAFRRESRHHDGISHLLGDSGRYPLCGVGRINTFAVFAELNSSLISSTGRTGFIVPTSIATADTTKFFFSDLVERDAIASLYSFFEIRAWFPDTDSREPFCLLTLRGTADPVKTEAQFIFDAHDLDEIANPERRFSLTREDFIRINPNTRTCPIFRARRDAEIARGIYSRVPVLLREARDEQLEENPWGVRLRQGLFNMTSASHLFFTRAVATSEKWELRGNVFYRGEDRLLPLYEAKLFHQFDHRWATYLDAEETRDLASGEKIDPAKLVIPRYWVDERECLLVASDFPDDLRAALRLGNKPESKSQQQEAAEALRRELGRWLAGWNFLTGQLEKGRQLLRDLLGKDNRKRSAKTWQADEEAAIALARGHELLAEEAARLGRVLNAPYAEQVAVIWALLKARAPWWFFSYRRIARSTDTRTCISTALPFSALGDLSPIVRTKLFRELFFALLGNLNSIGFDFVARQKIGGTHLDFHYVYQFPVLRPETYEQFAPWDLSVTLADWLRPYVLELCYTAYDLRGFAEDCGHSGAPFRWDDSRRAQLRAELDAAFFILYGLDRDDTLYVLNTFEVLKKNEVREFGDFQTATRILSAYDVMSEAARGNTPFVTRLDPPPAHPSMEHGITRYPRKPMNARITRATIGNYRSLAGPWNDSKRQKTEPLAPATLSLDQVTVLVGINAAGKSSFCDALAFVSEALRHGLPGAIDNQDNRRGFASLRRHGGDAVCIRIEVEGEGLTGHYELEIAASTEGYRVVREAAKWRAAFAIKDGEWESGGRLENSSLQIGPTALQLVALRADPRFFELADFLSRMVVYSVPPIELRKSRSKSPASPMEGRGEDWPSAFERVLAGPSAGMVIVGLNRLTGDIADARVQSIGKQQMVQFLHREPETTEGGRWASADQESDGTLRVAAILTALMQDPPPSLIAIEEPELAIHPGALTILYDFIQSAQRRSQILVTTHSPDLLDNFEADLIRVVYREGDVTRIAAMDEDQRRAVREKLTTLGDVIRHEGMRPDVE